MLSMSTLTAMRRLCVMKGRWRKFDVDYNAADKGDDDGVLQASACGYAGLLV